MNSFPADMVILQSSETKGSCYVETKNLDGETNLKTKQAPKELKKHIHSHEGYSALEGKVKCEPPNNIIHKFEGTISIQK